MRVRFDLIRRRQVREPGEFHAVVLYLDADVFDAQRLSDKTALCLKQPGKVAGVHLVERYAYRKPRGFIRRSAAFPGEPFAGFALEALCKDRFEKPFHLFGVIPVAEGQRAVFVDGVGVDLVCHARHSEILRFDLKGPCDGLDQALALRSLYVESDFHSRKPPCFFGSTYITLKP